MLLGQGVGQSTVSTDALVVLITWNRGDVGACGVFEVALLDGRFNRQWQTALKLCAASDI